MIVITHGEPKDGKLQSRQITEHTNYRAPWNQWEKIVRYNLIWIQFNSSNLYDCEKPVKLEN